MWFPFKNYLQKLLYFGFAADGNACPELFTISDCSGAGFGAISGHSFVVSGVYVPRFSRRNIKILGSSKLWGS